jgi:hypothetical protein
VAYNQTFDIRDNETRIGMEGREMICACCVGLGIGIRIGRNDIEWLVTREQRDGLQNSESQNSQQT